MSVADKLETLLVIKDSIKDAIIEKGVDVSDDDAFTTYADKILQIEGGGDSNNWSLVNGFWGYDELSNAIGVPYRIVSLNTIISEIQCKFRGNITFYCLSHYGELYASDIDDIDQQYYYFKGNQAKISYSPNDDNEHVVNFTCYDGEATIYIFSRDIEPLTSLLQFYSDRSSETLRIGGTSYYIDSESTSSPYYYSINIQDFGLTALFDCFRLFYFSDVQTIINIPYTEYINNMSSMFESADIVNIDFTNWRFDNVVDMNNMFKHSDIEHVEIINKTFPKLINASDMFLGCRMLASVNLNNWTANNLLDASDLVGGCSRLVSASIKNWNVPSLTSAEGIISGCESLLSVDLSNFNAPLNKSCAFLFSGDEKLKTVNLTGFSFQSVEDASFMFNRCCELTDIIGIEDLDTRSLKDAEEMFVDCDSLEKLDFSNWNTDSLENMKYMFNWCSSIKSITFGGNLNNVTNIYASFMYCPNLNAIKMLGRPPEISITKETFWGIADEGTFYYNGDYDYTTIIAALPDGWTAVAI